MERQSVSPPTSNFRHGSMQDDPDFPSYGPSDASSSTPIHLSDRYSALRLQFAPLRRVEADLKMALGAAADEVTETTSYSNMVATPFDSVSSRPLSPQHRKREFCVRSHDAWKSVLVEPHLPSPRRSPLSAESSEVIAVFRSDIRVLWRDGTIRDVILRRRIALEDSAE